MKESDMKERRRSKRRELLLFLPVYDLDKGEILGHLADITTDGIMLFSQQCIELGKKYALEIKVEDLRSALVYKTDEGEHECIQFSARSRWIAINPELYRTGFMFMEVSAESRVAIDHIIHNLDLMG